MSELDNNGRADFAAEALATYHSETRSDPETYGDEGSEQFVETFGDLLGDLQHLARRAGVDFADLLASGTYHFDCEVGEEAALARQEQEEEALKNGPVDDQVYAMLSDDPTHFGYFRATSGLDPAEIRRSLLRLQEQGKADLVTRADTIDGKGWRRTPVATEAPTDTAPDPAQAPPKSAEDALREIAVHLALNPEWDGETTDGIVEVLASAGLPSVGDMGEVEYWIAEARRLGVWHYYEDTIWAWADDLSIDLPVFTGGDTEALEGQGS